MGGIGLLQKKLGLAVLLRIVWMGSNTKQMDTDAKFLRLLNADPKIFISEQRTASLIALFRANAIMSVIISESTPFC